jgi:hypothetical protein
MAEDSLEVRVAKVTTILENVLPRLEKTINRIQEDCPICAAKVVDFEGRIKALETERDDQKKRQLTYTVGIVICLLGGFINFGMNLFWKILPLLQQLPIPK